jgi:hypothetical protein
VQTEAAMYELGGIYKEQLKEPARGYETYTKQVSRYPHGANAPEAYYLLYLYYKGLPDAEKMGTYAAALQREFPTSTYAKLIADPLYREHELALHNAVAARVDSAFTLYKEQSFTKAKAVLARTERTYPKSDLNDRIAYVRTLLAIRTQPPMTARAAVEQFYKDYPSSPLVPQAQALADTYRKAESGQLAGALASTDKPVISIFRPGEVDNRLRIEYEDQPSATVVAPATPALPAPTPPVEAQALSAQDKVRQASRSRRVTAPKAVAPRATPPTPANVTPAPSPTPAPSAAPTSSTAPVGTASPTPAPVPNATAPPVTTPSPTPPPAAPAVAYTTQLSAAHAVALVYPKGAAPTADLVTQLTTYNGKFFRANNLVVQPAQPLGPDKEVVVVRTLPGSKVAQSYATKLRGPQSPLARLRGQGYQALVISLANLTLLQEAGDVAGYQQFFDKVYQ